MKKVILRIPLAERILAILFVLAVLLNPLSNAQVLDLFDRLVIKASKELGVYATVAFAVYAVGYIFWNIYQKNQINIPSKTAKTQKAGKLIVT